MAPKKSAAAAGEEDGPNLTLIMEKGPLSGQRNDFRPGSLVHIGRLVRGNTLSIKDAGVSSKHFLIQFAAASDPDSRQWTITDLGSSNGTSLNGEQLDPSEPVALSDCDVIKIGEQTSIKVKFQVRGVENEIEGSSGNVRRNTRRRVREKVCDLVVIEEDAELGLQKKEDEEEIEKVAVVEAKQGRNVSTRRTRNSAKNESLAKDEEDGDLGSSGIRGSRGVSTRRTRNARKDENVDEIGVDLSVIEDKKTKRGGRGRKKQDVETISEETEKEEPIPSHKTCEEERERSNVGVDEIIIEVKKSGTEGAAAGFTSSSGLQEGNEEEPNPDHKTCEQDKERSEAGVDESGIEVKISERAATGFASSSGVTQSKGKMVLDLENMTLGEWLDFLDVHEPQEIINQTEEMLTEMRRKAERCHEFRLQHKNAKAVE